jgi:hypothetical protein
VKEKVKLRTCSCWYFLNHLTNKTTGQFFSLLFWEKLILNIMPPFFNGILCVYTKCLTHTMLLCMCGELAKQCMVFHCMDLRTWCPYEYILLLIVKLTCLDTSYLHLCILLYTILFRRDCNKCTHQPDPISSLSENFLPLFCNLILISIYLFLMSEKFNFYYGKNVYFTLRKLKHCKRYLTILEITFIWRVIIILSIFQIYLYNLR